ncbi:MAG: hypothetical protein HC945_01405 [Nitrosarchaeum sp.]|nr:hypothetical protein [Nitrosarchaeum sp.]
MDSPSVQEMILSLFIQERNLNFKDIQASLGVDRETIAHHLTTLINQKRVEYTPSGYRLAYGEDRGVYDAIRNSIHLLIEQKASILLTRRLREPYKHFWELPSLPMSIDKSIEASALTHAKTITGQEFEFSKTNGIIHRKLIEKNARIHTGLIIACTLSPINPIGTTSPNLEWFSHEELTAGIVAPTDLWILQNLREERIPLHELFISEGEDTLIYQTQQSVRR